MELVKKLLATVLAQELAGLLAPERVLDWALAMVQNQCIHS
jgi:hypothetical protein